MSIPTVSVFDLAAYLVTVYQKKYDKAMTAMKLQKLVYYCQAWHLVWKGADKPIFRSRLEAWINGPVSPELFWSLKGKYSVEPQEIDGDPMNLTIDHREIAKKVLDFYASRSAEELTGFVHQERPWIQARRGVAANERGGREIPYAEMERYYSELSAQNEA